MSYGTEVAVSSQIIQCGQSVQLLNVKLVMRHVPVGY
jgi:hypothetical protein